METDKFSKPYIKARDLQEKIAGELIEDPTANNIDLAERLYSWFVDLDKPKVIEIFSFAISHLRPNVEDKINGKPKRAVSSAEARARGAAAAKRLLLEAQAKWLLSLTYERIDLTVKAGPALKERMQPGQKVSDVWSQKEIVRLLK